MAFAQKPNPKKVLLISTNIRGAVYKLLGEVDAWNFINAWHRCGFRPP